MATYIFRSNVRVTPPEGVELPILGPGGLIPAALGVYISDMAAAGHTLSASEVAAFRQFYDTLVDEGIWAKTLEIYPLFGRGTGFYVKMKRIATSPSALMPANGWGAAHMQTVGGVVVGKAETTHATTENQPCLRTGVRVADLQRDWGAVAHLGGLSATVSNVYLFGASQTVDATAATAVGLRNSSPNGGFLDNGFAAGSAPAVYSPVAPGYMFARSITGGFEVTPGLGANPIQKSGFNTDAVNGQDQECFLFARNGFGTNSHLNGRFPPRCRFFALTRGLTQAEGQALMQAVNALQTALGRQF